MGHVAVVRLRWGDGWIEPGQRVPDAEPGRNYALMLEHGQIEEGPIEGTPVAASAAPVLTPAPGSAENPVAVNDPPKPARKPRAPAKSTGPRKRAQK